MQQQKIKVPTWANAESTADISDIWVEEVDRENEDGSEVIAHLSTNTSGFIELDGISVEEDGIAVFYDRLHAAEFITIEAIWRIEELEQEAA